MCILLSDSENGTEAADRRKTGGVCQCGGEKRTTAGIVPEEAQTSFDSVFLHVHAHVCG